MIRFLKGKVLNDREEIKTLLEKSKMISVNQMNAQIKLQEIWKSLNIDNYPLKVNKKEATESTAVTRSCITGKLTESSFSNLSQRACVNDAIRLWNKAPKEAMTATSLNLAKKSKDTSYLVYTLQSLLR